MVAFPAMAAAMASPFLQMATDSDPAADEPPDDNVGPALIIVSSVFLFLVLATTVLRLLVRARNRMLGWDDLTIVLVAILSAARLGCQAAQVHFGDGRHRTFLDNNYYETANRLGWYALLLFFIAICLLKISICLLLLRIKNERWLRRLIYGMMAGLVLTNGGVVVILLAECRPVDKYWDDSVGSCWDPRVRVFSIYLTIGYAILTDLLCSCLPLVVIWKVRIPLKSKLLVCGLMSLGLLATGCGIGRAASLSVMTDDFTWAFCITEIWANCELFVGAIAANLALSRAIYIYFFEDTYTARHSLAIGGNNGVPVNGGVGSGPSNGPSGGSAHRLSFYGYQSHGLAFLNSLNVPWSWRSRSWRSGRDSTVSNTGTDNRFGRHHTFRRQSSYSPNRLIGSNGSSSRTVTMETATTADAQKPPIARLTHTVRRVTVSITNSVFFWRHRAMGWPITSSTDSETAPSSREKCKSTVVGVTPVRSHDGSVTMVDGVVVQNSEAGGRRGSVASAAVVITGGRGRALDRERERERGHARNGRSISSSTTVTSRRRSSLYYHHHLSKQHPYSGGATAAKPWSAALATTSVAASDSDDSGLPSGAGVIKKRTEFWISEEELDRDDFEDDEEEAFVEGARGEESPREATQSVNAVQGNAQGTSSERALAFVTSTSPTAPGPSRGRTISNASTATAVDGHHDADTSSNSGSSTSHNNGSEEDLELGLHPPPRAHLS